MSCSRSLTAKWQARNIEKAMRWSLPERSSTPPWKLNSGMITGLKITVPILLDRAYSRRGPPMVPWYSTMGNTFFWTQIWLGSSTTLLNQIKNNTFMLAQMDFWAPGGGVIISRHNLKNCCLRHSLERFRHCYFRACWRLLLTPEWLSAKLRIGNCQHDKKLHCFTGQRFECKKMVGVIVRERDVNSNTLCSFTMIPLKPLPLGNKKEPGGPWHQIGHLNLPL